MHDMKSIEAHIKSFESYLEKETIFPKNRLRNLYEPCTYFLSNAGKRIRPTLCLLGAELFGPISDDAFNIAVGIELFHNFTLLHDDIMDEAPLRRGETTVHLKYGTPIAILAGDVMSIYSYKYFTKVSPSVMSKVLSTFNKMAIEVCEGQQLDMDFEQRDDVSIEEYLEMIRLKTSVLIGASLKLGGVVQNATEDQLKNLNSLGIDLGMAFQLKDDYLDTFGLKEEIGKLPGGDIRSHKKTYLYIVAQTLIQKENPTLWEEAWAIEDEVEKVEKVTQFFKDYKVDEYILKMIEDYSKKAFEEIALLEKSGLNTKNLETLANYLLNRQH